MSDSAKTKLDKLGGLPSILAAVAVAFMCAGLLGMLISGNYTDYIPEHLEGKVFGG